MNVLLRRLLSVARSTVGLSRLKACSRGMADIPIRKGPFWDMGWPYPWMFPWTDLGMYDDGQQEYLRRMDKLLRVPPMRRLEEDSERRESNVHEYGLNAEIVRTEMDKENLTMEIELNVSHYEPDELFVNLTGEWIIVTGRHGIRPDKHGFVTRHFTRQFHLQEGMLKDTVTGRYTEKGNLILSVKAINQEAFNNIEKMYTHISQKTLDQ